MSICIYFHSLATCDLTCCLEIFNDPFFLLFFFFQRLIQKNSKIELRILCFMGRWVFLVAIHVFIGMSVRWVKKVYFQNNKPNLRLKALCSLWRLIFCFCFRLAVPPSFNERPIIFLNILPYRYWSFLSVISAFLSMHHQCLWQPKANSLGVFILSFSVMELILPKNFKKPSLYVYYLLIYLRKYLGYYNCFFFNVGSSYHCEAGSKVFDGMVITFLADWYS